MNWQHAINRHRRQLIRIVATLFAMVGLAEGRPVEHLSRPVYRAVLRLLRPAESAVRRLIVVAARGITLKPPGRRSAARAGSKPRTSRSRPAAFRLFDPRQRFTSAFADERPRCRIRLAPQPEPRLRVIDVGFDPRIPLFRPRPQVFQEPPPAPMPDGMVKAARLSRRLVAIKSALDNLPRQAKRYARWQAKPQDRRRPQFVSALRPGTPPGHRKKPIHKVDAILAECHWLARQAARPDTS